MMNNAVLYLRLRIDTFNRCREALKAINARNKDILYTTVVQVFQHAKPVVGTFRLWQVKAQQLFFPLNVEAENGVHRFSDKAPVLFDFIVNGIKPDNRVDRFLLPLTPSLKLRQ